MINFEMNYFMAAFPVIMKGFWVTTSMAFISLIFAVLIGFVLAAVRYYKIPVLT